MDIWLSRGFGGARSEVSFFVQFRRSQTTKIRRRLVFPKTYTMQLECCAFCITDTWPGQKERNRQNSKTAIAITAIAITAQNTQIEAKVLAP